MAEEESRWNEQQLFAQQFFKWSDLCKTAQVNGSPLSWYKFLRTKISVVMGVCNKEEKDRMWDMMEKIEGLVNELKRAMPKDYSLTNSRKKESNAKYKLNKYLFFVESEVDTIANKHLPFLNIKKKSGVEGL